MTDRDTLEARLEDREYYRPPTKFVGQANATDPEIYDRFDEFPAGFEEYAEVLTWDKHWDQTFDGSEPPFFEWFVGGKLNASVNCIDRHLEDRGDQTALLWESEDTEERRRIAYQDLYRRVNEVAAMLRDVGVEEDDIVTLRLPLVPGLLCRRPRDTDRRCRERYRRDDRRVLSPGRVSPPQTKGRRGR